MATSAALQGHYDEIRSQMQVLPLGAAPKGFAQLDLASLTEGSASAAKVTSLLSKAAAGLHQCQICGSTSSSSRLGFLVSTKLDFSSRSVRIAAGQFACEVCRAVSSPALLLQLSTPLPQSEDFTRADKLKELFLHFAAVNSAPAHVTANPEALALWVQELACRAYSMCVVASSLKGWKLLGPDGQVVQPGATGAAVHVLQQLLSQSSEDAAAAAAANGEVKGAKKRKQAQHAADMHTQAAKRKAVSGSEPGSSKQKVKKQAGDGAAAAAVESVQQPATTPKQQGKTPKQRKADKTPQQLVQTPQHQQQQQQQQQATKAKTARQQAGSTLLTPTEPTPSKAKKRAAAPAGEAAAKQAAPFKTPQVDKSKKAAKSGKRRLSNPS